MSPEVGADRLSGTDEDEELWGVVVVDESGTEVKHPLTFALRLSGLDERSAEIDAQGKGVVPRGERVCVFGLREWKYVFKSLIKTREDLRKCWRELLSRGQLMQAPQLDS